MKLIINLSLLVIVALTVYVQPAKAPELVMALSIPEQSVAHKRQRKIFGDYDRIVIEEPVRQQKCVTVGTIWYRDACWRPERIPHAG